MPEWAPLNESNPQASLRDRTEYLRVPGGWLYRTTWFVYDAARGYTATATSITLQPERAE